MFSPKIDLGGLKKLAERLRRKPSEVVGLDLASSGTKVVRLKKSDAGISLVSADILPPMPQVQAAADGAVEIMPLELRKELVARNASLAVSGKKSVVKLVSFTGASNDEGAESRIVEGLGVEHPETFRIGYRFVREGHGKTESRALVVAIPEGEAAAACKTLPTGAPAPYSVELAGLAAMTAFLQGPGKAHAEDSVGMIEFGSHVSYFAVFSKLQPVLIRKFDFGSSLILEKVQQSLGIDQATAEGILTDGSFDISQQISEVLDGFIKQVIVSRDFVERRENCRINKVYTSGGITKSRDWLTELKSALGYDVDAWNPFAALKVDQGALPEHLNGQETRFSAAVGAALATLQQDEQ